MLYDRHVNALGKVVRHYPGGYVSFDGMNYIWIYDILVYVLKCIEKYKE